MKIIKGWTLVELLMTLTVGFILLQLMTTVYLHGQANFFWSAEHSELQENARMLLQLLKADLRMAGYIGCAKLTEDFPLKSLPNYSITPENKLTVLTRNNSDEITVRHASIQHANLTQSMINFSELEINQPLFAKDDILMISDCKAAEIFQAAAVHSQGGTQQIITQQPLSTCFAENSEVSSLEINTYYVANTARRNKKGEPISALFLKDMHQHKEELAENIQNLKMQRDDNVGLSLSFAALDRELHSYIAGE